MCTAFPIGQYSLIHIYINNAYIEQQFYWILVMQLTGTEGVTPGGPFVSMSEK